MCVCVCIVKSLILLPVSYVPISRLIFLLILIASMFILMAPSLLLARAVLSCFLILISNTASLSRLVFLLLSCLRFFLPSAASSAPPLLLILFLPTLGRPSPFYLPFLLHILLSATSRTGYSAFLFITKQLVFAGYPVMLEFLVMMLLTLAHDALILPTFSISSLPVSDYFPVFWTFLHARWESFWSTFTSNKLHAVKPSVSSCSYPSHPTRCWETVLARLRIGHTRFTHSYLMSRSPLAVFPFLMFFLCS